MWLPTDWQYPCYNPNNGRIKAIFKWKNSHNLIYEEQTDTIIPALSFKRPHSRILHISSIAVLLSSINQFQLYSFNNILTKPNCDFDNTICKSNLCQYANNTNCNICYLYKAERINGCRPYVNKGNINTIFKLPFFHNFHLIISIPFLLFFGYLSDKYGIRLVYTFSLSIGFLINLLMSTL